MQQPCLRRSTGTWPERGSGPSFQEETVMIATHPTLILHNGRITTLDRQNPEAAAVAMHDGRFVAVGSEREVMPLAGPGTRRIDLKGRRVIPGLIDSHMHIIRGGLNYNMELRWDGVRSLAQAMRMLKE